MSMDRLLENIMRKQNPTVAGLWSLIRGLLTRSVMSCPP